MVADSIETASQLAYAFAGGCDVVQGPVFAEPMFEEQFLAWLPLTTLAHVAAFPSSRDLERENIEQFQMEIQQRKRSTLPVAL